MFEIKLKRCPDGKHRSKKTRLCETFVPRPKKTVKRPRTKTKSKSKTNRNAVKIANFMKRTKHQRHGHFLKNICSDSGVCIAFGIESNKIKTFFNQFVAFDYVVAPITAIGAPSANGFVKELNYRHRNYVANAILKSSVKPRADNLFYEYSVGLQINQWTKYFPCFVETYGLYTYKSPMRYGYVKNTKRISDVSKLKDALTLVSTSNATNPVYNYADICQNSKYYAVLIQHIRNAKTMLQVADKLEAKDQLALLAQVYFPLGQLTHEFVHYDLHRENVMMYQPAKNKYIHFYYHFKDGSVVQFKSYYVAKIIDYGRSYIKDSVKIHDQICKTRECNPMCGTIFGFGWMEPNITRDNYYISSINRNPSHDIRLFNLYFPTMVKYDKLYGTEPVYTTSSVRVSDPLFKIKNVMDASNYLKDFIVGRRSYYLDNAKFPKNKQFGELHIYMDMSKPMRFVKT